MTRYRRIDNGIDTLSRIGNTVLCVLRVVSVVRNEAFTKKSTDRHRPRYYLYYHNPPTDGKAVGKVVYYCILGFSGICLFLWGCVIWVQAVLTEYEFYFKENNTMDAELCDVCEKPATHEIFGLLYCDDCAERVEKNIDWAIYEEDI